MYDSPPQRPPDSPGLDDHLNADSAAEPSAPRAAGEQFKRNDSISPVIVAAVVLFWIFQSSLPDIVSHRLHSRPAQHGTVTASVSSEMPSDLAAGIPEIALEAKQSYLGSEKPNAQLPGVHSPRLRGPLARLLVGKTPLENRRGALATATALLKKYPDQAIVARSVILLRAETGDQNPLGLPIAGLEPPTSSADRGKVAADTKPAPLTTPSISPLSAYKPVKDEPAGRAAARAGERQIMIELFSTKAMLSSLEEARIAQRIREQPQLRWWGKLALHQAALRSGDTSGAARFLAQVRTESAVSATGVSLVGLVALAGVIAGIVSLIILLARRFSQSADPTPAPDSIFAERAPLIADEERRLGAGDLGNLFFLYLALMVGIDFAVTHAPNDFIHRALLRLPYQQQFNAVIIFAFGLTALSGLLTMAAMFWLAKKRGASLSREIGLNLGGRSLARTALFGFLGWSISLPLAALVEVVGKAVFHGAPDPANPIIPVIMAAPTGLPMLLLYLLAAFLAPFFEETMFRGLFFNAARLRLGTTGAILLTGAAFGLTHQVGIGQQCALATLGGVLAWMASKKKSLLPGMFAHFYQNTFVFGNLAFSLLGTIHPHL